MGFKFSQIANHYYESKKSDFKLAILEFETI